MPTLSEPEANGGGPCAPAEYSTPAGYGTLRLRENAIPFGAYAEADPVPRRAGPDYRAQVRDTLARFTAVTRRLDEDQREIDRLRLETRSVIDGLLAA